MLSSFQMRLSEGTPRKKSSWRLSCRQRGRLRGTMGCANGTAAAAAAPYDPAFAASQSWLDISGATAYDRVFVRLAEGPRNGRVMAEVEGSGCDNCGRFLFRRDNRIGMLAYCRKNGCKEVLLTLDKQSSESSRFPIPEVHEGWVEHTVLVERHSVDGVHTYREPDLVVDKE